MRPDGFDLLMTTSAPMTCCDDGWPDIGRRGIAHCVKHRLRASSRVRSAHIALCKKSTVMTVERLSMSSTLKRCVEAGTSRTTALRGMENPVIEFDRNS